MGEDFKKYVMSLEVDGKSGKSIRVYLLYLNKFFSFNKKKVEDITYDDVVSFLSEFKNQNTVNTVKSALKGYFNYKQRKDISGRIRIRSIPRKIKNLPIEKEILNMIKQMPEKKKKQLMNKAIVITLYGTGLRVNELVHLDKEDFRVNINQVFVRVTKFGNQRVVEGVPNIVFRYVNKYWKLRRDKSKYAFTINGKKRITTKTIETIVGRQYLKKRINMRITPHDLRYCYITHLREAGVKPEIISRNVGHRSLFTTLMIYSHPKRKMIKEELAKHPLGEFK